MCDKKHPTYPLVWHMGMQNIAQTDVGGKKEMRERDGYAGGGTIKKKGGGDANSWEERMRRSSRACRCVCRCVRRIVLSTLTLIVLQNRTYLINVLETVNAALINCD
ncbi:hypothetical protein NPIL_585001 [Nephila pilipes]|uniref:Uncharacterized protein n=1 Tax=Nephila pilipes TaxID=299642 RepID=A0A8X6QNL4_NEPPI|nr:hypothetical protein NPIL_585001 [Nephila pilipes]